MDIKIFQTYYKEIQNKKLDSDFVPLDNTNNHKPLWTEYWLFLNHYKNDGFRSSKYSGILSWKFNDKTNLTGQEFINFIQNNDGHDVYFINPYPYEMYCSTNIWHHGEYFHPGLIQMAQNILDDIGYNIDLSSLINDERNTLFCNYWVGSTEFWEKYMDFTLPIFDYINNSLSNENKKLIYSHADKSRGKDAAYFSFIFERLFTTLLVTDRNIKYIGYEYNIKELQYKYNVPIAFYIYNNRIYSKLSHSKQNTSDINLNCALSNCKELIDEFDDYMNAPSILMANEIRKYPIILKILMPIYYMCAFIYKSARNIFYYLRNYIK